MPRTQIEPQFHRAPVHPRHRRQPRRRARAQVPAGRAQALYRAMVLGRRLDERMVRAAAAGTHRHLRAHQGPGGRADRQRLGARGRRLDGAVLPRDGGDDLAGLAASRRCCRSSRATSRAASRRPPARSADRHPRGHAAPARGRARLRHAVPGRRRGRHGLLRRRRHVRGRLPRGDATSPASGTCRWSSSARTTSGPSPCRSRSRRTPGRSPRRRSPTACPASRWTATTCWRSTRRAGSGRAGARRRRPDADRVRHLSARRAHHRRRPDQVPLGRGGRGVGAQGPAHALPRPI